jgi:hypothetical protein
MTIYVIKGTDGLNFVYVKTSEEAVRICTDLPGLFTWEPLELYRDGG